MSTPEEKAKEFDKQFEESQNRGNGNVPLPETPPNAPGSDGHGGQVGKTA